MQSCRSLQSLYSACQGRSLRRRMLLSLSIIHECYEPSDLTHLHRSEKKHEVERRVERAICFRDA